MTIDDENARASPGHADSGSDQVCLGRIGGAHGVRGAVQIQTFTHNPEDIGAYGPLLSKLGDRRFEITVERRAKSGVIARLAGVDTRDAASALTGTRLFVARAVLPAPPEDEFYHADLVGLKALATDGAPLGHVVAVQNFGAGDVLEIKAEKGGKTVMVPFDREVVPTVDLRDGLVRIDLPESLRKDLN